jgi:hypothetical protein
METTLQAQLDELNQLIDVHLNQCDHTYTPTICQMKDTPEGKAQVHKKVLSLCLAKGISVGQAVNEIEKEFNPNLNND